MAKSFLQKTQKNTLLGNSKAYPSWQKLRDNDDFLDLKKSTFFFFYKGYFS